MQAYTKAIAAFLTSSLSLLTLFGVVLPEAVTPENITTVVSSAMTIVGVITGSVYQFANKEG